MARSASTRSSSLIARPMAATDMSAQRLKSSWRVSGTPSTAATARTGSGTAKPAMKSTRGARSKPLTRSAQIARISGSRSAIRRGVKARETRPRYREWLGGSSVSIVDTFGHPSATTRPQPLGQRRRRFGRRRPEPGREGVPVTRHAADVFVAGHGVDGLAGSADDRTVDRQDRRIAAHPLVEGIRALLHRIARRIEVDARDVGRGHRAIHSSQIAWKCRGLVS